ncbi:MAG: hypothetical protein ACK4N5_11910 [Myxococcales bacterium]
MVALIVPRGPDIDAVTFVLERTAEIGLGALIAVAVALLLPVIAWTQSSPCASPGDAEERLELTVEAITIDDVAQPLPPPPQQGFVVLYEDPESVYGRLYDPDLGTRDRLLVHDR